MKEPRLQPQPKSPFWYADYYRWNAGTGEWERKFKSTWESDQAVAEGIARAIAEVAWTAFLGATRGHVVAPVAALAADIMKAAHKGVSWRWTKVKAEDLVNEILAAAEMPTATANRQSWRKYKESWWAANSRGMKESTQRVRLGQLKIFDAWIGKDAERPMHLLTEARLQEFWGWMTQHYTGATPVNTLSFIKGLFRDALNQGVITQNPAALVKKRRSKALKGAEREPYSAAQIATLLAQCATWTGQGEEDWVTMVLLGLCTGARFTDCQTMGMSHVLKEGRDLSLRWQPKKTEDDDHGPITVPVVEPLLSHLRALMPGLGPGDPFCPKLQGWSIRKLSDWFGKLLDAARVGGQVKIEGRRYAWRALSFHSLRHTLPTWLASVGVPEATIMKITGHRSVKVARGYTHTEMDAIRTALNEGLGRFTKTKRPAAKTIATGLGKSKKRAKK